MLEKYRNKEKKNDVRGKFFKFFMFNFEEEEEKK